MSQDPCPPNLYKYTSFGTARIVLTNGRLRWTTASLLNDPFDMSFDLHLDIYAPELRRLVKERFRVLLDGGHYARTKREDADLEADLDRTLDGTLASLDQSLAEMHRESRQWTEKTKILCLTVSPGNMLMWSHYAEQHFGAVLRFTTAGENNAFQAARPVIYSDEMPRFLDTAGFADMILGADIDVPSMTRKQIYTKASAWSYEEEWRINFGLCRDPQAPVEDLRFGEEELDGVILGCRMSPAIASSWRRWHAASMLMWRYWRQCRQRARSAWISGRSDLTDVGVPRRGHKNLHSGADSTGRCPYRQNQNQ